MLNDAIKSRFSKIEQSISNLLEDVNKLITATVSPPSAVINSQHTASTLTSNSDFSSKLIQFDPSVEKVILAMENSNNHPTPPSLPPIATTPAPPKRKSNLNDFMDIETEIQELETVDDTSERQQRLTTLTKDIRAREKSLLALKRVAINMEQQLNDVTTPQQASQTSPKTKLSILSKSARNEFKRVTTAS